MKISATKIRLVLLLAAITCLLGCAGMNGTLDNIKQKITSIGGNNRPVPIATSIDQMPPDAASLAAALHEKLTESSNHTSQSVRFSAVTESVLSKESRFMQGFKLSHVELYGHDASQSHGLMKLESPLGRIAACSYNVKYASSGDTLVVNDITLDSVFSQSPAPVMFVVPAEKVPRNDTMKASSYGDLLQFAAMNAIDPHNPALVSGQMHEYVIFVFFVDRVSTSAKVEVKISDEAYSYGGYKDATHYLDFDGWRVALLSGRFSLSNKNMTNPGTGSDSTGLFLKAIFTPGKEAGLLRLPKQVGLFCVG